MRVKTEPDEFQSVIFENYVDIMNVLSITKDKIVYLFKEDNSNDDYSLNEFLQRTSERNRKIYPEKLVVFTSDIPFLGHIVSKDGA